MLPIMQEYLQSFYAFCQSVGGPTEEVMCGILAVHIKHVSLVFIISYYLSS